MGVAPVCAPSQAAAGGRARHGGGGAPSMMCTAAAAIASCGARSRVGSLVASSQLAVHRQVRLGEAREGRRARLAGAPPRVGSLAGCRPPRSRTLVVSCAWFAEAEPRPPPFPRCPQTPASTGPSLPRSLARCAPPGNWVVPLGGRPGGTPRPRPSCGRARRRWPPTRPPPAASDVSRHAPLFAADGACPAAAGPGGRPGPGRVW